MSVSSFLKNVGLSAKVNGLLVLVFGLLLAAIVFTMRNSTGDIMVQTGQQRIEQENAVISSRFDELTQSLTENAVFLANAPGLSEAITEEDLPTIRTIILTHASATEFDEIDLVDTDNNRLFGNVDEDPQDEDALLAFGLMGIRTADVFARDDAAGGSRLAAVSPVIDAEGQITGAVVISRPLNVDFMTELNLARTDPHVVLILGDEMVADGLWLQPEQAQFRPDSSQLNQALRGQAAVSNDPISIEGSLHMTGYVPLTLRGEKIGAFAVVYNLETLAAFENQLTVRTALIFLALTLIAVIVMALFTRINVISPLERLQSVAERMTGGDYATRADTATRDEIGHLGQAFNQMATAVQEREKDLKGAQRIADENSRLKSEFLATMSHELRTPLNAIEGFTSIMLAGMGVELQPNVTMMLERISANSDRLLSLINDFLDLSRIESGRMELVSEPIVPRELAEKLETEIGGLAEQKGLDFRVDVSPDLPPLVYGDKEAITKIAVNLLGNAVKFTHKGHVALNLKGQNGNGTWAIEVSDTGIGIPPHAREFIFDEFRQVDSSAKREYGGTGLGLAIVSRLTRVMGGNVTLTSEVGQGSVFTVTLPLKNGHG